MSTRVFGKSVAAVLTVVWIGSVGIAVVSIVPVALGNASARGELPFSRIILDAKQSPWGKAIGDIDGDGFADVLAGFAQGGVYWYAYQFGPTTSSVITAAMICKSPISITTVLWMLSQTAIKSFGTRTPEAQEEIPAQTVGKDMSSILRPALTILSSGM